MTLAYVPKVCILDEATQQVSGQALGFAWLTVDYCCGALLLLILRLYYRPGEWDVYAPSSRVCPQFSRPPPLLCLTLQNRFTRQPLTPS